MNAQATYIKYLKKEITESDFAYQVRRNPMLKEYISPVNSVADIISILKGKGVIWEEQSTETPRKEPFDAFKSFQQHMMIGNVIKEEKDQKLPKESGKKKPTADDVNYYEFTMGWRWEYMNNPTLKKTQNIEKAREIAVKNIAKDPMYYSQKIYGDTFKKQEDDRVYNVKDLNKNKTPAEQAQLKDKENDMKVVKDQNPKVANVTGGLKKAYIDKGQPQKSKFNKKPNDAPMAVSGKTKATALKEAIKKSVKGILKDPAYESYIKKLRESLEAEPDDIDHYINKPDDCCDDKKDESVVKEPKDLASQFDDAHKSLKKPVKEDDFNADVIKKASEDLLDTYHTKEKALERCDHILYVIKHDPTVKDKDKKLEKYTKVKEYLEDKNSFSTNEDMESRGKFTDSMVDIGVKALMGDGGNKPEALHRIQTMMSKADPAQKEWLEKVKAKIEGGEELKEEQSPNLNDPEYKYYVCQFFKDGSLNIIEGFEYENDAKDNKKEYKSNHPDIDVKVLSKKYLLGKKINPDNGKLWHGPKSTTDSGEAKLMREEFQDNTAPEYASEEPSDQIELEDKGVSKAEVHQGKMHKVLGVKPGEEIKDKYNTGESLYDALSKKLSDHDKVMKMLNYAANISKEKDVFDAAVRYGKEKK